MQLTDAERKLFESLAQSGVGTQLVSYLKRLQSDLCDARNWNEHDTKESTVIASAYIQKGLIDKIMVGKNPPSKAAPNIYS